MATESIGALIPTAIPGYADAADIQAALRAYHYGSYSYDPANTSATSLVANSIAKYIYDIEQDIIDLENRPSSGGEVDPTEPAPGDFTPPGIPDGFIWVDENGTLGGAPTSATSIFTNSAPTSSLTTGLIWVDKDADSITDNPFIPTSAITAKGDLIVGLANDSAGILSTASTNGYILSVNSSTTSGLEWVAANPGDITGVTAGTGISGGGTSGTVTVSIDTAVVATTNNTLTMTNKTLTSPVINLSTNAQTGTTYTLALTDNSQIVEISNASPITLTVPANTSVAFPTGSQINILQTGAGQITVAGTSGVTVNATPGLKLRTQWSSATLIKRGTDTWVLVGDLSA